MQLTIYLILLALIISVIGQFVMSIQMERLEKRVKLLTTVLSEVANNTADSLENEHY